MAQLQNRFGYWPMHLSWRSDKERLTVDVPWTPMHWPLHEIILSGRMKDSDIVNLGDVVSGNISRNQTAKERVIMATGGMVIEDFGLGLENLPAGEGKRSGAEAEALGKISLGMT